MNKTTADQIKLDKPIMTKTGKEAAELDRPGKTGPKCEGTIYHDHSSNGIKNGRRVFKNCWRAEITTASAFANLRTGTCRRIKQTI